MTWLTLLFCGYLVVLNHEGGDKKQDPSTQSEPSLCPDCPECDVGLPSPERTQFLAADTQRAFYSTLFVMQEKKYRILGGELAWQHRGWRFLRPAWHIGHLDMRGGSQVITFTYSAFGMMLVSPAVFRHRVRFTLRAMVGVGLYLEDNCCDNEDVGGYYPFPLGGAGLLFRLNPSWSLGLEYQMLHIIPRLGLTLQYSF